MKRIGVYAGSFNPFHVGHANILHKAQQLFDEVIIAIGKNPAKANNEIEPFPIGNSVLGKSKVIYFTGLLSDYLNELDVNEDVNVWLVRGLRTGEDLQYESNQLQFIQEMYPSLKVNFFLCDKKFEHISSSALRHLKSISPTEYKKYVFEVEGAPELRKFGDERRYWMDGLPTGIEDCWWKKGNNKNINRPPIISQEGLGDDYG